MRIPLEIVHDEVKFGAAAADDAFLSQAVLVETKDAKYCRPGKTGARSHRISGALNAPREEAGPGSGGALSLPPTAIRSHVGASVTALRLWSSATRVLG